ncbi:MAG: molecular chaperone DnaJ [Patescibacteria group bacterium]
MKDYYQILGISKSASQEEIKKAYRRLAHRHHPDKGGDEKQFKEISEAYQVLSDQDKRAQYDKFGRVFEGAGEPGFGGFRWGWHAPPSDVDSDEEGFGFDFQDIGDIFDDFFGGTGARRQEVKRGRDIELEIEIPLEAALKGTEEKISLLKFITCSRCQGVGAEPGTPVKECFSCRGTGQVQQIKRTIFGSFTRMGMCPECGGEGLKPEKLCNVCKGEGRINGQEEIHVSIPPGIDTNQVLKIERKGDVGRRKGKGGDFYVRVIVKPHKLFRRKGDDVSISIPIQFSQAALGDEVEVPTLEGTAILLIVPPGSESGKIVRIAGKGIPHFAGLGRGNMYVELKIQTPKKLTKEQKELLEKLRQQGI